MNERHRHAFVLALVTALVLVSLLVTVGIPGIVKAPKTHLGLDLQGGTELVFQARPGPNSKVDATSIAEAMNIIRQGGASIGTAVLSVILASAITTNLSAILGSRASGSRSGGLATLQHLPATAHGAIAGPLANAFASTFVWAFVLILVALIPAVGMAVSGVGALGVIVVSVRAGMGVGVLATVVEMALPVERFVSERQCVWHVSRRGPRPAGRARGPRAGPACSG